MLKRLLPVFLLLGLAHASETPLAPGTPALQVERGIPGALPGTERWHVTFKSRSFDLLEFRAAVYARASAAEVARIVAELEEKVQADQADFVRFLGSLGGAVTDQWWLINACAVEVAPERLEEVRQHARVAFIHPDQIWQIAAPIRTSTNTGNHMVDPLQAQNLLAQGGVVAIMDSGLDVNMAGVGRPHRTFFVDGNINNLSGGGIGGSRILANYQMGNLSADDPHGHGTGVAGIAAGEVWGTSTSDRGHAPRASIVGYGIADGQPGSSTSTVMTRAWQKIAADRALHGTLVANNSYSGSPSPTNTTQQALDSVALNADILPVVAAGNNGPSTASSQSCTNGLAVGAVATTSKAVASFSSRGPLSGDTQRFYPDMSACGVSTVMPRRDNESTNYTGSGTSMAAPQVAGAATLFRSIHKTATALETKAVMLATTEDISQKNPGLTRNDYGLGFLRDDNAIAMAQGQGLLLSDTLTSAAPSKSIPLNVTQGKAYAAVVTWHRHNLTSTNWSNLALAAKVGALTLASSDTPRNLYEKVVFLAPATGSVILEVSASSLEVNPLTFAIAAFEVPAPYMPGDLATFGQGCPGTGQADGISAILPRGYATQWGQSRTSVILGYYPHRGQQIFDGAEVPAQFTANGIAFRSDDGDYRSIQNYWIDFSLSLGATTVSPAAMSTSFAANITRAMTTVIASKRINLPYWSGLNTSVDNWNIQLPLDQPFNYVHQAGTHFLMDSVKSNASTGAGYAYYHIDAAQVGSGYPVSRLYSSSPTATTGTRNLRLGAVLAFTERLSTGALPRLGASSAPVIGNTTRIDLDQARAQTGAVLFLGFERHSWFGTPLPFDLAFMGAPGCPLLTGPVTAVALATDAKGAASLPISIPNDKALIQGRLYIQAIVVDPPANKAGLAVSNGLELVFGGQP